MVKQVVDCVKEILRGQISEKETCEKKSRKLDE